MRVLIAGAGELGQQIALRLHATDQATLLRRTARNDQRAVAADLTDAAALAAPIAGADLVIFCAAPNTRSASAYEALYLQGLENVLRHRTGQPIFFCSSTAVYGAQSIAWVDESTAVEPENWNGQILVQAERLLQPGDVALRLGGIYSSTRRSAINAAKTQAGQLHYTNRIHIHDAAAAIVHLLALPGRSACYNLVDQLPCTQARLFRYIREHLHWPEPESLPEPNPMTGHGRAAGKRVASTRLAATGFRWQYPSFKEGYAAVLRDMAERL
jgi:nucleoside-diphosphate-sugar epimerase